MSTDNLDDLEVERNKDSQTIEETPKSISTALSSLTWKTANGFLVPDSLSNFETEDFLFHSNVTSRINDNWEYNFEMVLGPDNTMFIDAKLNYMDLAGGYHLDYNPNGILWRVNAVGIPHPDDYHKFLEQNRVIDTTAIQTMKQVLPTNSEETSQVGWHNPLEVVKIRGNTAEEQRSNMFGWVRADAYGNPKLHQGVDIVARNGTPIRAVQNGVIYEVNDDPKSATGYGSYIILKFEQTGKTYYAFYTQLSEIHVSSNQLVEGGQVIGLTGTSGNAAGLQGDEQHLHFEIATTPSFGLGIDTRIDPMPFFAVRIILVDSPVNNTYQKSKECALTNPIGWHDPLEVVKIRGNTAEEQRSNMFGWVRADVYGNPRLHQGVDIVARSGTPIRAVQNGVIYEVNDDPKSTMGYGSYIILKFEQVGKDYYAFYAHLSEIQVSSNQIVEGGQVIGLTGTSGNAAGFEGEEQHLHFEIATTSSFGPGLDTRIDPMPFLNMNNGMKNEPYNCLSQNSFDNKLIDTTFGNMTASNKLVSFIAAYEDFSPTPYRVTPNDPLTIGYGHVIQSGENFGGGISRESAWNLLKQQINQDFVPIVNQWAVKNNVQLTQQQFDALVSFVYNIGGINENDTPSLIKVLKDKNTPPEEIRRVFGLYRYGADGPLPGLVARRRDEADMYLYGDYRRKSTE